MAIQHLTSSTANKRPTPAAMADAQIAINSNTASPGLFFKDSAGALIKVGPVHVGTTAPNASPASGGQTGNSVGEQWLDTTGGTYVFKVWDGSAWRSETGTFVDVNGDTMTGALGIIAGSASTPGLFISGDTNTGLYSPGADQLAISTNGTGRLFVDASGNVGVGASAVSNRKLTIDGGASYAIQRLTAAATEFCKIEFGDSSSVAAGQLVYDNANDSLTIATNNSERLRITSDGKLGLGTSSPSTNLSVSTSSTTGGIELTAVSGNTTSSGRLFFSTSAGSTAIGSSNGALRFFTGSTAGSSSGDDRLIIDSSGRVGIGTTSPTAELDIERTTGTVTVQLQSRDSSECAIDFGDNSDGDVGRIVYNHGDNYLGFITNASERARIDGSGRLLVGTSSARNFTTGGFGENQKLHVETAGATSVFTTAGIYSNSDVAAIGAYLELGRSKGTTLASVTAVANNDLLGEIRFAGTNGSASNNAASIAGYVDGTVSGGGANDMPGRLVFSTTPDSGSSPVERMRINNVGQLQILTESTSGHTVGTTQSASGSINLLVGLRNATTTTNGTAVYVLYSNGTYATISDETQKKNIESARSGYLDDLKQLRVVKYNWNDQEDSEPKELGLIAQEVEQIFPGLVSEIQNGDGVANKAVKAGVLPYMLLKALQEAAAKIETLEAKVAALEAS